MTWWWDLVPSWAAVSAGGVLAVGVVAGVVPVRGGSGQHAGSGPGALTVWQLYDAREPAELDPVAWPSEDVDEWTAWLAEALPRHDPGRARLLEPFELCDPPVSDEPEYVGRHRLADPLENLRLDLVFHAF